MGLDQEIVFKNKLRMQITFLGKFYTLKKIKIVKLNVPRSKDKKE